MASVVVIPPTQEPVTLAQVKAQSRISHDLDDVLLTTYIAAARDYLQIVTRRQFVQATLRWAGLQHKPGLVILDNPPLHSVTLVEVLDASGIPTILDPTVYVALTTSEPGQLLLLTPLPPAAVVRVTYVAGWPDPTSMPPSLVQAMLLLVSHWYENREASTAGTAMCLPYALEALIWANKLVTA